MEILVTGGAGYIGTHTLIELITQGHNVVVVDNFSNSSPIAIERVAEITGKNIPIYNVDIRNRKELNSIMKNHKFHCCIHFAGLKSVGESVEKPLEYYDNNINGTLTLLDVMKENNCK
ncbi:MAG: SDR family NAD(P)-dependent oxidoreductase, partial [Anaerotignaceae bacterium]